jgi:hypothetical protein
MTTLTLRYIKGDFVVTGQDIEPMRFKTRREAKDWCRTHYPDSLIKEIGPIYKPPQRGVLEAEEKNTQAAADIVCAECKSIMATLYASKTDPN